MKESARAGGLFGLSLLHASLGMAIVLEQSFAVIWPARLPLSQLLTPFVPIFVLYLLLSEGFGFFAGATGLALSFGWQLGYLIWVNVRLGSLSSELSSVVAQILIGFQLVLLLSMMYLLFSVYGMSVRTRFNSFDGTRRTSLFSPWLFWLTVFSAAVLLELRLLLASWHPQLNAHILLFFAIMSPVIQVNGILKHERSLTGLQGLLVMLLIGEIVYLAYLGISWVSAWPSAGAIALSIATALSLALGLWNLEQLKHLPFNHRLVGLARNRVD